MEAAVVSAITALLTGLGQAEEDARAAAEKAVAEAKAAAHKIRVLEDEGEWDADLEERKKRG